jgi:hypothetical protein
MAGGNWVPGVRLGVEEREAIALGLARGEPLAEICPAVGPSDVDGVA